MTDRPPVDRSLGCAAAITAVFALLGAVGLAAVAVVFSYDGYGSDARRVLTYASFALFVALGLAAFALREAWKR